MKQRGRKSAASLSVFPKPALVASNPAPHPPAPPRDLDPEELAIYKHVVAEYQGSLTSYDVLISALAMHRRARLAAETIEREGLLVPGRDGQPKSHPLCVIERDARRAFQQVFKVLGIKL
jgi:hypothetical protein